MIETIATAPTTLVVRHTINAPQQRVYAAWTTPDIMKTFIAPEGVGMGAVTTDLRVGGAYSIEMLQPDGSWFVRGTYTELHPYDRIAFTWAWDEDDVADVLETHVALDLIAHGEQTELVLTHTNLRDEASRDSHAQGWSSIIDNLEKTL